MIPQSTAQAAMIRRALGTAILLLSLTSARVIAVEPPGSALYERILAMDARLFTAFNECDLATFDRIMGQDLEVYDDRSGLNTDRGREIASFKDRCSTGVSRIVRELVPDSVEVYALGDSHAMQTGRHRFLSRNADGVLQVVAEARFIHIWDLSGDMPRVVRVVSYEHHDVGQ